MEYIIVWSLIFTGWMNAGGYHINVENETIISYSTEADCEKHRIREFSRLPQLYYKCSEELAKRIK